MLNVFTNKAAITGAIAAYKLQKETVGFVPTMGALHQGHLALVKKALLDTSFVVVSIFVNPTQFDNNDDLEKYPRTLDDDVKLLQTLSKNRILVYAPSVFDIYQGKTVADSFNFDGLEFEMEGRFRTGHFDGVGTIVKRFFEIIKPQKAYFGEKDFQQLAIIKKMVQKHAIPVQVIGCPIYRESSGLAMSSRNTRLNPSCKAMAPFIYKTLATVRDNFGTKRVEEMLEWVNNQFAKQDVLKLEYFIIADVETLKPAQEKQETKKYRAFIAVYADDVRLIDNIALN